MLVYLSLSAPKLQKHITTILNLFLSVYLFTHTHKLAYKYRWKQANNYASVYKEIPTCTWHRANHREWTLCRNRKTAPEWLDSFMTALMFSKSIFCAECWQTDLAFKWPLTSVHTHMAIQISHSGECCTTHIAAERLLSKMGITMYSHVPVTRESQLAHITLPRFVFLCCLLYRHWCLL